MQFDFYKLSLFYWKSFTFAVDALLLEGSPWPSQWTLSLTGRKSFTFAVEN
jgi:hypothetical protein